MTSCWVLSANDRPKFTDLRGLLEASMYNMLNTPGLQGCPVHMLHLHDCQGNTATPDNTVVHITDNTSTTG